MIRNDRDDDKDHDSDNDKDMHRDKDRDNDKDIDIRLAQPKYGYISDRRYILRDVIRLKEMEINVIHKPIDFYENGEKLEYDYILSNQKAVMNGVHGLGWGI